METAINPDTWPHALSSENKPWTRWWWLGSSLNEYEITRQLTLFEKAGMGGVEISPIYAVPGYEAESVPYLSDRWIELLAFTLQEAARLNMGVDMILGTGWPFGGPAVTDAEVPRRMVWAKPNEPAPVDADLIAQTPDGLRLYLGYTKQQVKRAAPGGEGNVLDHYDANAVRRYFAGFDGPLSQLPANSPGLRCVFNDSFEVFGANATPDILSEFQKRRGYDLAQYLPALHGSGPNTDTISRVRSDYRETIGDLVRDAFLAPWNEWAHEKKNLDAQSGARVARQPAGFVRAVRHSRNRSFRPRPLETGRHGSPSARPAGFRGRRRSDSMQNGVLGGARCGPSALLVGIVHVAGRTRLRPVVTRQSRSGHAFRAGHQPYLFPRHAPFAGKRGMARLAFLREYAHGPHQYMVGRFTHAQYLYRPLSVVFAGGCARQRRAFLLPVLRLDRKRNRGARRFAMDDRSQNGLLSARQSA